MQKIRKEIILSIIYFIGLPIILFTGLCEFNWLFILAIVLGVVGVGFLIVKEARKN